MTRCIQWWSNSTRRGHCLQSYKEMLALITQLKSLVLVCVVVLAIKLTRQRTICILALTPELHVTLWYFSHCKCSRSTFLQRDWSHDSPSCLRQAAGADKSNPSCYDDPVYTALYCLSCVRELETPVTLWNSRGTADAFGPAVGHGKNWRVGCNDKVAPNSRSTMVLNSLLTNSFFFERAFGFAQCSSIVLVGLFWLATSDSPRRP